MDELKKNNPSAQHRQRREVSGSAQCGLGDFSEDGGVQPVVSRWEQAVLAPALTGLVPHHHMLHHHTTIMEWNELALLQEREQIHYA